MIIRKCCKCGNDVEVKSNRATRIKCESCQIANGWYPKGTRDYDTDELIFCRKCGKVRRRLDIHIKKDHKITAEEYLKEYPDAPIHSKKSIENRKRNEESKEKTRKALLKSWAKPEVRKKRLEIMKETPHPMKGKHHSEEMRRKIGDGVIKAWEKTAEERKDKQIEKIIEQKKNLKEYVICPICFKDTKNKYLARYEFVSPVHIASHGYTMLQFKEEFQNFKFKTETLCKEHSEKLSGENHFNYGKNLSEETRENISRGVSSTWDEYFAKECIRCKRRMKIDNEEDLCHVCRNEHFDFQDTENYVYCRVCNLIKQNLAPHIKDKHNMTIEDYKEKYGAEVFCESLKKLVTKNNNKEESLENLKKYALDLSKLKVKLEENFNILNYINVINQKIPNTIGDMDNLIYCRYCLKQMKRVSDRHLMTHNLTTWMYRKIFPEAPLVCDTLSKQMAFNSFQTRLKKGEDIGKSRGFGGYRKDIGHYVRSMNEANFCRILQINNILYEYEPKTFKLKNSKFSSITPDFYLLEDFCIWKKDDYIEMKGWYSEEELEKIDDFLDQYPKINHHLLVVGSEIWRDLMKDYKHLISLWEDPKQNIKNKPELYK